MKYKAMSKRQGVEDRGIERVTDRKRGGVRDGRNSEGMKRERMERAEGNQ